MQGPEPLGAGVLEGNGGQWPLSVTPHHLSCVVPSMGARLVRTELPGALLGGGQEWEEGSSDGPHSPRDRTGSIQRPQSSQGCL